MEITCITVDCADPAAVAAFWNDALGWGGVAAAPDASGAICGPKGGGMFLEFIRVPEAKFVKNRGTSGAPRDRSTRSTPRSLASDGWERRWRGRRTFPPRWQRGTETWSSATSRVTSSAWAPGSCLSLVLAAGSTVACFGEPEASLARRADEP